MKLVDNFLLGERLLFLKTGDIFALPQSGGSSTLLTELWKIALNPGASCFAQFLSIMFEMLSGPIAFDVVFFVIVSHHQAF